MAATTTLPLFWHLASVKKDDRIDASVKLVSALQQFQENHILEGGQEESGSDKEADVDEEEEDSEDKGDAEYNTYSAKLDLGNAADVAYAIRRLIRGLASPRESSRLGFAVALTELLSRIDTVTCQQIIVLVKNASQTLGSMTGQEERDMLFARLFGLKAVIQSGLLFSQKPLRSSSTNSSSLKAFESFLTELLALGEKKSWLRESCWWSLLSSIEALSASNVPWKENAFDMLFDQIYINDRAWGPEKVALTLKLQKTHPNVDWQRFCGSYFRSSDILAATNLIALGRLLKESNSDDSVEEDSSKQSIGPWKPQLHFVWDVILDTLLSGNSASTGNFQDFYRIVVDEALFASSSSPQRKYWGFLVFQKALLRLPAEHMSMLFTRNFMRTWINQLSKNDRYLHKIARQVATDVQQFVEKDPKAGFTLVLQLTGTNGSFHFDRITKTKTVETILANMDSAGIKEYIDYLLAQINEGEGNDSFTSIDTRRIWIVDQMTALVRKGSIPKTDESLQMILYWFAAHGLFKVVKKSPKSSNLALHVVPEPEFSDDLRSACRAKLLACLGDLTSASTAVDSKDEGKPSKASGVASDGELWISKVFGAIIELEKDFKHVTPIREIDEEAKKTRKKVSAAIEQIKSTTDGREPARGSELLLNALALKCICDDEEDGDWEILSECADITTKLFVPVKDSKKKKKKKEASLENDVEDDADRPPIDLVVDIIIGLLEHSTTFTRNIANQSFALLTPLVTDSTVNLILAQLERRDPAKETDEEEDVEMDEGEGLTDSEKTDLEAEDDEDSGSNADSEDGEVENDEEAEALRKALQAAISIKEAGDDSDGSDDPSDEASMDDEQMMAIDEKLAAVFRTRAEERKKGKDVGAQREATYFKNRVLDLVEAYLKKQSSNPLVLRFILPLVELVATASSDEKQLTDKAKGILRSRITKTKDIVPINDTSRGVELLESLHQRARKAHSLETVSTISMCSLFVTKALLSTDEQAVIRIYKESMIDFITRKASALNPAFVIDFIRRHPIQAWTIRTSVVDLVGQAINGYRQSQAFGIIQALLTSLPQPDSKKDEIMAFVPSVSSAFLDALSKSCLAEKPLMTSAHMKDSLKITLQTCRFTKRIADDAPVMAKGWTPKAWDELASELSSSETFKASISLANACKQISKLAQADNSKPGKAPDKTTRKRKQEVEGEDTVEDAAEDSGRIKPKRKKVRKAPKGGKD